MLPINEIFETVQGEATWTGSPSIFIRLQGCGVGCPWCDTKHTWHVKPEMAVAMEVILQKKADGENYSWLAPSHLARICQLMKPKHVVITGGEPCIYDLRELTQSLFIAGKTVQIETSGTQAILCGAATFVTVSPKIGMPGGFKVLPEAIDRANEIKMPVGKIDDVKTVRDLIDNHAWKTVARPTIWLQPLSQSEKATKLCIEQATLNGWRISIQTHKFLGVR